MSYNNKQNYKGPSGEDKALSARSCGFQLASEREGRAWGAQGHPLQPERDGPCLEGGGCPQAVAETLKLGKSLNWPWR